jgi:AcrR family transcriptional regulator
MAKKRDDEGMRKRLIEAALVVFSKQSHLEASIDAVAAEAQLAKGTVYLYFKSRDELIIEMFRHCVDQFRLDFQAKINAETTSSAADLLHKAIEYCLKSALESRNLWGLWYHFMALSASEKFREPILKVCQSDCQSCAGIFSDILRRGIATGEFRRDTNIPLTSLACFGLITGFLNLTFIETLTDLPTICRLTLDPLIQNISIPQEDT